jgi:hypothetical protein
MRLGDDFHRDPRARAAGKDGRALYVAARCWSSDRGTDGAIPDCMLPVLACDADVPPAAADALVAVGLWSRENAGWRDVGYLADNPSSDAKAARSARISAERAAAGRAGADSRWQKWQTDGKPMAKEEEEKACSSSSSSSDAHARATVPVQLSLGSDPPAAHDPRVVAAVELEVDRRQDERRGQPLVYPEAWRRRVREKLGEFAVLVSAEAATDPDASAEDLWRRARGSGSIDVLDRIISDADRKERAVP